MLLIAVALGLMVVYIAGESEKTTEETEKPKIEQELPLQEEPLNLQIFAEKTIETEFNSGSMRFMQYRNEKFSLVFDEESSILSLSSLARRQDNI